VTRAGIRPMSAAVALGALGRLLAAGIPNAIVANFDRPVLRDIYESRGGRRLLSELSDESEGTRDDEERVGSKDTLVSLSSLSLPDRLRAIDERVRLEIARVLELSDPRSIDPNQSLFELGLDSLMALELRRRLARIAGTTLPAALAFNYPNLSALITLLDETITEQTRTASGTEDIGNLLSRIDDLSGAELDSLLAQMLGEEGVS
jgi:phthiocerol/phenolphthiocerol synthesis type-I polyketide synthase D